MNDEIVAGDANGRILLRRAKSSLERAEDVHGPVQQVAEIQVHADCYHPAPDLRRLHHALRRWPVLVLRLRDGLDAWPGVAMSRDLPRGDRDDVEDEPFKDPPNCPTCAERDSPVLTVFTRNRGSRESRQVLTQATTVA